VYSFTQRFGKLYGIFVLYCIEAFNTCYEPLHRADLVLKYFIVLILLPGFW
jgi:hypothetical protein